MSSGNPDAGRGIAPEFLTGFDSGRLAWDSLASFPNQSYEESRVGDVVVDEVGAFLRKALDPEEVDRTRRLPDGFVEELQERGYLRLRAEPALGGLGLSAYNAFRVIESAAAWSVPAGQMLGIQAGVGAGAMLPAMPPGPLRDFVRGRIAEGMVSGFGDTDASGQNNAFPTMTATLSADGSSYLLRGSKVFIGHGTIADLLGVSATVEADGERQVGAFFVDTRHSPGFRVTSELEYLGSHGLPNGGLAFDDVRVPREHALLEPGGTLPPAVGLMALVGRVYFTGAPALAIARNCLGWSRDFVSRRTVDGRALGSYDSVRRIVATTAADVFAMDSAARWSLSGDIPTDRLFERFVTKNVLTTTSWRVVDRTMSLLAGEGFETVASKKRRGVPAIPLERAFRDARGLRIAGNIDFRLDEQAGRMLLNRHRTGQAVAARDEDAVADEGAGLSPRNRAHLRRADRHLVRLGHLCARLVRDEADAEKLFSRQRTVALIGRVATEVFTMCAVLSRVNGTTGADSEVSRSLADIHCSLAEERIAGHWREIEEPEEPDYAGVSAHWLSARGSDDLLRN